jgi:hypothetical protein
MDMIFYVFLLTMVLTVGVWWLWFLEYKKFFIDDTRQKLFSIRDELFKAAANGDISFEDKSYKMTRTTLNGAIQYTHNLSAVKLVGSIVLFKLLGETPQLKNYQESWKKAFSSLESDSAKKIIVKVHQEMHLALFHHLVRSSIVLRVLIFPFAFFLLVLKNKQLDTTVTSSKTRKEWLAIDVEANSIGQRLAV